MNEQSKMIKIMHNGPIFEKGGVCGPMISPFVENSKTIFAMIVSGKKVYEVLPDKTEVLLTISNFDKVNGPAVEEVVKDNEPVKPIEPYKPRENKDKYKNKQEEKKPEPVVDELISE